MGREDDLWRCAVIQEENEIGSLFRPSTTDSISSTASSPHDVRYIYWEGEQERGNRKPLREDVCGVRMCRHYVVDAASMNDEIGDF